MMDRNRPFSALSQSPVRPALVLAAALLAAPVVACSGGQEGTPPEATEPGEPAGAETAAAPRATSGGPIASNGSQRLATPAAGGAGGELIWELPEGWTEVPPANRMRMAQASIPGPGGPADLVLFYFGPGQGGDARSNIERWLGQMEIEGEPEEGSFESGDLAVSWVDVAGTQKPSGMGVGPSEPVPGSRLLGAVVEGPGGPWFFKATGPDETLAAARDDFLAMLRAARVE